MTTLRCFPGVCCLFEAGLYAKCCLARSGTPLGCFSHQHNTRLSATFQLAPQWGNDAAEAYEAFGEMLVGGGFVADEAAAHEACRKLQRLLVGGADDGASNTSGSTAAMSGTGASVKQGFRALEGGPVLLDEVGVPADGAVWLHHESTCLLINRLHRSHAMAAGRLQLPSCTPGIPVHSQMNKISLHPSEIQKLGKNLIQVGQQVRRMEMAFCLARAA